jgi:hypothetical protein
MRGLFQGKIFHSTISRNLFFIFLLLSVSFYYNYHEILFKRPQSVHAWRQADCASIALNYYQKGMHFFRPEVHNLTSDQGTTGYCATSEFPVLYYLAAVLYKVFGYHEWFLRAVNTLVFLLGLFCLFSLFRLILQNTFWSAVLSLLLFTSPVLVYYGNNFLSDTSALSFVFLSWYFFFRFQTGKKPGHFNLSWLFFLISGLLKISALLSFTALFLLFLMQQTGLLANNGKIIFRKGYGQWLYFLSVYVIVAAWVLYARFYNKNHDCTYFSTTIFPIWNLDSELIRAVFEKLRNVWLGEYFSKPLLAFNGAAFICILIFAGYTRKQMIALLLLIFSGVLAYSVLWFYTFAEHDYYTINLFILPAFSFLIFFDLLKKKAAGILNSSAVKLMFLVFLAYNIQYTHRRLNNRYAENNAGVEKFRSLNHITLFLHDHNINPCDTIVSIPDDSHVSLYLMNHSGWTNYTDARLMRGEYIRYNQDSAGIARSIANGAKYLVVQNLSTLFERPYLQPFAKHLVGTYKNILVFSLDDTARNYTIPERVLIRRIFCDAENLANDSISLIDNDSGFSFGNAKNLSSNKHLSGRNAVMLSAGSPFGMTLKIDSVQYNDQFRVTAFKDDPNKDGALVASGENSGDFYVKSEKILSDSAGWYQLGLDFFIPKRLHHKKVIIYLYYPKKDTVYFDDMKVEWYSFVN